MLDSDEDPRYNTKDEKVVILMASQPLSLTPLGTIREVAFWFVTNSSNSYISSSAIEAKFLMHP